MTSVTASSGRTSPSTVWPDDKVCIGDRYRIGEAEFEVTQPRVTCYRVGLRLGEPELPALLVGHHRPGFYMRVITEGHIQAGDAILKTRTGPHALSVADTDALLYLPGPRPGQAARRRADPRPEPRLAEARSATCWPLPGVTAPSAPRSRSPGRLACLPGAARGQGRPGGRDGVLDLPRRGRRRGAPGRAGRAVPDPADHRRRPARPGAQLLAIVGTGRRDLPDQRQARAARHRQQLPEPPPGTRSGPGGGRAPR